VRDLFGLEGSLKKNSARLPGEPPGTFFGDGGRPRDLFPLPFLMSRPQVLGASMSQRRRRCQNNKVVSKANEVVSALNGMYASSGASASVASSCTPNQEVHVYLNFQLFWIRLVENFLRTWPALSLSTRRMAGVCASGGSLITTVEMSTWKVWGLGEKCSMEHLVLRWMVIAALRWLQRRPRITGRDCGDLLLLKRVGRRHCSAFHLLICGGSGIPL